MRRISAQYIFTSAGQPLKRGIVTVADDGTVLDVEDSGGRLTESAATEFYNGIIIPGLVNSHAHLELSHMKGIIPPGGGLGRFITSVRDSREAPQETVTASATRADREMWDSGVTACGDISNSTVTAAIKKSSHIRYITFAEVFGIDPSVAEERINAALQVADEMRAAKVPVSVTPHSLYSLSQNLSDLVRQNISPDAVISMHFLESDYERSRVQEHAMAALELARLASRLLLVHNTVITREEAEMVAAADNTWFCLCPTSNMYISGKTAPAAMLAEVTDRITAGTDSLASTGQLSMITELQMLGEAAPRIPLHEIIRWGTINGARALKVDDSLGSIEPGKKPGLLLADPVDLVNLRLLPGTRVRRLI